MSAKFVSKPVVISAEICNEEQIIDTLEGNMVARVGDWIITGTEGEKYPCKDSVFRAKYEPVNNIAKSLFNI